MLCATILKPNFDLAKETIKKLVQGNESITVNCGWLSSIQLQRIQKLLVDLLEFQTAIKIWQVAFSPHPQRSDSSQKHALILATDWG